MPDLDLSFAYNSYIKNIYLELPEPYTFNHQSLTGGEDSFLGREKILASFVDILFNGRGRGAYLVTGYRGMGKTSFVNNALRELIDRINKNPVPTESTQTESASRVERFRLSLAQSELKDVDILKHIVNQLLERVENEEDYRHTRWFSLSNIFSWLWPLVTLFIVFCSFGLLLPNKATEESKTIIENLLGIVSFSGLLTLLLYKFIDWTYGKYTASKPAGKRLLLVSVILFIVSLALILAISIKALYAAPGSTYEIIFLLTLTVAILSLLYGWRTHLVYERYKYQKGKKVSLKNVHEKLKLLHNRCNAQITREDQFRETFSSSISSLFKKDVMIYPIANPREIESELITIISDLTKGHFKCIFVFDELDKVDTNFDVLSNSTADTTPERRTHLNDLRERRHRITQILGSLKFFINEANAQFIFIAGREMFEAALADISDRQSPISSIFHRVIYVDSFLKDQSGQETITSSIGVLVERLLGNLLLADSYNSSTKDVDELKQGDFFAAYYQQLIKSQKSLGIDEEAQIKAARKIIFVLQNFLGYLVYRSNGSPKKVVKLLEEYISPISVDKKKESDYEHIVISAHEKSPTHYLHFSYLAQYKLGFTAYLFQPFLTMYSSFMKRYSDNTLVSTPYLIDNLIKFHPFAFSAQNLELIPEILSTNKSPISRPFLEELVAFLGQTHIRRTESGLFEYKFYDRTHNEITYISKLFEDEAAAFNFTLDENFSVKAHLISKIKQLREAHRNESVSGGENPIGSIIFLNRILGDVRFQDEEYEDAIVSYQDAIQMLAYERLFFANNYITFVRIKLKLGLAYEKIKDYEFALGHYAGVIEEGGDYLKKHAKKHEVIYRELLMLVMQAYSAILYLQEKLPEGITFHKLKHVVQGFEKLIRRFYPDHDDRDIMRATFYSNIGTALYYKNMVLPQKVNEAWVKAIETGKGVKEVPEIVSCFPTSIINPEFSRISAEEIQSIDNPLWIHSDARVSFSTYLYYKLTLKTLLGCPSNELFDMLIDCPILIRAEPSQVSYRGLQHSRRLTSIGHALAKLGDFLLPMVRTKDVVVAQALGCFYEKGSLPLEQDARKTLLNRYFAGQNKSGNQLYDDLKGKPQIHPRLIIHIYYLASLFYVEAAETANAVFQLRKILFTLRSLTLIVGKTKPGDSKKSVNDFLDKLESNLVKRILELSSWMSHSSDRPQLAKTKKYFGINTLRTPHTVSSELYGNLSNNPDTKDTILVYALLKSKYQVYSHDPKKALMACYTTSLEHKLVSPYGSIAHHIMRIMELELHTNMNYKILLTHSHEGLKSIIDTIKTTTTGFPEFNLTGTGDSWERKYFHACKIYDIGTVATKKSNEVEIEKKTNINPKLTPKRFEEILLALDTYSNSTELKQAGGQPKKATFTEQLYEWMLDYFQLILNSIFNLSQIDRIINTYGINYMLSYSYMAKTHEHLGTWLKHLQLCRILNNRYELKIPLDETLEKLVGPQLSTTLDALTAYQVALQFYYQAIQLHKEGNTYRHQVNNLVYLEDDYNDNLYHFGAALERLRINSGAIRERIDFLEKELVEASMYNYSTHIGKVTDD